MNPRRERNERGLRTRWVPGVTLLALLAAASLPVAGQRRDFPTRPPGDPAAIERGRALYGVNCTFCHGPDIRGGDGGPSLLRAAAVLDDRDGELIAPVVRGGRVDRGMPKFAFTDDQLKDIVAFIHSFTAAGYDVSRMKPPSILVGDAKAGQAYFGSKCATCHAPADMRGFVAKFTDDKQMQQNWLMPGSGGRGGPPVKLDVPPTTVVVTQPSGATVEGVLDRIDDFVVSLTEKDGTHRSFSTTVPGTKVEVHDPLQPHRDLLRVYSDSDIHNVTAFLASLK